MHFGEHIRCLVIVNQIMTVMLHRALQAYQLMNCERAHTLGSYLKSNFSATIYKGWWVDEMITSKISYFLNSASDMCVGYMLDSRLSDISIDNARSSVDRNKTVFKSKIRQ